MSGLVVPNVVRALLIRLKREIGAFNLEVLRFAQDDCEWSCRPERSEGSPIRLKREIGAFNLEVLRFAQDDSEWSCRPERSEGSPDQAKARDRCIQSGGPSLCSGGL